MMKKTVTVWVAALMLAGVGTGIPLVKVTVPAVAQAATLNAAKLPNGKYSVPVHIYKTGTTTASEAAQYFNSSAKVSVKSKRATVSLTTTKAGNQFIKAMTLDGHTAKVTAHSTGNTYTFSKVNLKTGHALGFTLVVPMNGQEMTMTQSAKLTFKTSALKATTKVVLTTSKVKAKAKKVTGKTTKGAKVTVKHGQTTLGKVTSKKAAYKVKLKRAVKKNWKLKVTASKAGYKAVTQTIKVK